MTKKQLEEHIKSLDRLYSIAIGTISSLTAENEKLHEDNQYLRMYEHKYELLEIENKNLQERVNQREEEIEQKMRGRFEREYEMRLQSGIREHEKQIEKKYKSEIDSLKQRNLLERIFNL